MSDERFMKLMGTASLFLCHNATAVPGTAVPGIAVPGIPVLRGGAAGPAHQLAGHRAPGLVLGASSRPRSWSR